MRCPKTCQNDVSTYLVWMFESRLLERLVSTGMQDHIVIMFRDKTVTAVPATKRTMHAPSIAVAHVVARTLGSAVVQGPEFRCECLQITMFAPGMEKSGTELTIFARGCGQSTSRLSSNARAHEWFAIKRTSLPQQLVQRTRTSTGTMRGLPEVHHRPV